MALSITATPTKTVTDTELLGAAKLNQLAAQTFSLSGTTSTAQIGDNTITAVKGSYGPWFYCTDGGTANAHSLTAATSGTTLPTSLVAGQEFAYTAAATNTGAVTVAVSGIAGTKALTKNGTTAMAAGDIRAGQLVWVRYDGTQFQLAVPIGQPRLDRYATTGGTATAYTATFAPTLTALTNGTRVLVKWSATNTSTATFAPDGLTAKAITKGGDTALVAGDIVANQISELVYDSTLDHWLLTSPTTASTRTTVDVRQCVLNCSVASTGLPNYMTGVGGTAISFQNCDTTNLVMAFAAGFDSSGAVDYVGVVSSNTSNVWSSLSTNGTYYLYADRNTSTGAITYDKTSTRPTYVNGTASTTSGDHTYVIPLGKMYLGAGGGVANAVQRVFLGEVVVAANVISTITPYMPRGQFKSGADIAITNRTTQDKYSDTHQLGVTPRQFRWVIVCQTAELDYAIGDEVPVSSLHHTGAQVPGTERANATTTTWTWPNGAYTMSLNDVSGASYALTNLTAANWKLRAYAWRGW